MTVSDIVLLIFNLLSLLYAIYHEVILVKRQGVTLLQVSLKRKYRLDSAIFLILLAILIYFNINHQGSSLTTWLLSTLIIIVIYLSFLRIPKLLFKTHGFYYHSVFIRYDKIENMNISQDGYWVLEVKHHRILIQLTKIEDMEKIFHFLVQHPS